MTVTEIGMRLTATMGEKTTTEMMMILQTLELKLCLTMTLVLRNPMPETKEQMNPGSRKSRRMK